MPPTLHQPLLTRPDPSLRLVPKTRPRAPQVRILVSSAGRRVGLIRAFRSSARTMGVDLKIFAADVQPEWSSACMEADLPLAIPAASSPGFIDAMLDICRRHRIDIVVPTIDPELAPYAEAAEWFAAIGTHVVIAGPDVVRIAADKLATADFLAAAGLPAPRTARAADVLARGAAWQWPLLAKPRYGSSGRGIHQVHDLHELEMLEAIEPYVVQDVLRGREYTINLYFDRTHHLRCAIPHERLKVRGGEVEKGVTVRQRELGRWSKVLARKLARPVGPICFQAFVAEDGRASMFEINTRFGGGYPLAHQAGATFTRWLLEEQLDQASTANNRWRSDVVMLRYDDAVFI